ncbi:DUF6157 family protein [Paenibacillus alkalitolerans]|uniref:DUF6157 family protein n=1 Tax=Paenibacillus alkalitolerans TaxID=2799335 RepID=UPI0018F59FFA|nr:DUF6157 family protein [Paenibacillus alkalitolerans]
MSYVNTFIKVAPDCPVTSSVVPVAKRESKPVHVIQYELLSQNPYQFTHEELLFEVHIRHKAISNEELLRRRDGIWAELFEKKHPCLRASLLPKKYGWGVHFNDEGKIALYGMETPEYERFDNGDHGSHTLLTAMRSSR